jgi:hypothetical protein
LAQKSKGELLTQPNARFDSQSIRLKISLKSRGKLIILVVEFNPMGQLFARVLEPQKSTILNQTLIGHVDKFLKSETKYR